MDLSQVYAQYLAEEERTRQRNVVTAREYYAGDHKTKLTERQEEFLGYNLSDERFAVNYCATVVDAPTERLIVAGFQTSDDELYEWTWDLWKHARMDATQQQVHHGAVNDGEYFVLVDWPAGAAYPRFLPHPRYTDPELGGTGFGCKAHYEYDDPNQALEAVSKRWVEPYVDERGRSLQRSRMNIYYPDRIERYVRSFDGPYKDAGWEPFAETVTFVGDDGELVEEARPPVVAWVDSTSRPLGIPFAHFRKPGRMELWDAIPLQDLINKTALDIIATADACGFPIRIGFGVHFTTDGKAPDADGDNYMALFPGAWISTSEKDARVEVLPPQDLLAMVETLNNYITTLAQVTDTPTSRFQLTRQVAAEGTLKQQEAVLLSKVRAYQTQFGNGWEDVFTIARRLANARGEGLNEDATLETAWEPAATRDETEEMKRLEIKRMALEIPKEKIWEEAGYNADEIAEMKAMSAEELQEQSNIGGALLREFERGG